MKRTLLTLLLVAGCTKRSHDLSGVWTNGSLTVLENTGSRTESAVWDPVQSASIETQVARARQEDRDEFYQVPIATSEGAQKFYSALVGYNSLWLDGDLRFGIVDGQTRRWWITEPADGKIPYLEVSRKRLGELWKSQWESRDNPDNAPVADRCLLGFGAPAGPPLVNEVYNSNYRILQSETVVVIVSEMIHDARIIRLRGSHPHEKMRLWMGDSIGRWEGNTLAVETSNIHLEQALVQGVNHSFYLSPGAKVKEWFTRASEDEITYRFEVDDPKAYSQPWSGTIPLRRSQAPIYEYACHEGNRSLENIFAAARKEDKK